MANWRSLVREPRPEHSTTPPNRYGPGPSAVGRGVSTADFRKAVFAPKPDPAGDEARRRYYDRPPAAKTTGEWNALTTPGSFASTDLGSWLQRTQASEANKQQAYEDELAAEQAKAAKFFEGTVGYGGGYNSSLPEVVEQQKQSIDIEKLQTDAAERSLNTSWKTDPEGYWLEPMSEEEWGKLSPSAQRAVTANALLFEASRSTQEQADQIYDFLGVGEERKNAPTAFASLEEIQNMGQPLLPDNTPERQAINKKQVDALATLRRLAGSIAPGDSTQSIPSKLNIKTDVPKELQQVLNQGISDQTQVLIDSLWSRDAAAGGFFPEMVDAYLGGIAESPADLAHFNQVFGERIKDLPLSEVKASFQRFLAGAKEQDSSLDIEAMMEFYGLGGK